MTSPTMKLMIMKNAKNRKMSQDVGGDEEHLKSTMSSGWTPRDYGGCLRSPLPILIPNVSVDASAAWVVIFGDVRFAGGALTSSGLK